MAADRKRQAKLIQASVGNCGPIQRRIYLLVGDCARWLFKTSGSVSIRQAVESKPNETMLEKAYAEVEGFINIRTDRPAQHVTAELVADSHSLIEQFGRPVELALFTLLCQDSELRPTPRSPAKAKTRQSKSRVQVLTKTRSKKPARTGKPGRKRTSSGNSYSL